MNLGAMGNEKLIPWSEVNSWACKACGRCCVGYRVPLKMDEYVRVTNMYGHGVLDLGMGKAYLKHGPGERCIFQHSSLGRWVCALQTVKPLACKLFPFRVQSQPVYKRGDRSDYRVHNRTFYVYLDPNCPGIISGKPSERFLTKTLPEVVGIGMGMVWKQRYTTSKYFL